MNIKDRMILDDFRKKRYAYVELSEIVYEKLKAITEDSGTLVMGWSIGSKRRRAWKENSTVPATGIRSWRI